MAESEEGLRRCLSLDASDPRTYVVLGKTLLLQKRYQEARVLYNEGVINTGERSCGFLDLVRWMERKIWPDAWHTAW